MKFIFPNIHRQAAVEKQMNPKMYKVLQDITDMVNFIATRPLINRGIPTYYNEVCSNYSKYLSDLAPELDYMSCNTDN